MTVSLAVIPEFTSRGGGRLGRHVHFDERSRKFRVPVRKSTPIVSKLWKRRVGAFDQGDLGSCTGNATVGVLCSEPFHRSGVRYRESLARRVYSLATSLDSVRGVWPPTDTGSTCLHAMKAAKQLGLVSGYRWGFGLDDALKTLSSVGPVSVGVSWYESFDVPDSNGYVRCAGSVRGGHAFQLIGVDVERGTVLAVNSWGSQWGVHGRFSFSFESLDRLLREDGECVVPVTV